MSNRSAPAETADPTSEEYKEWMSQVRQNGLRLEKKWEGFHPSDPPESIRNDPEIVLAAVRQNFKAFQHASSRLQNSKEFVLQAVCENGFVFDLVNDILKQDEDMVMAVKQQFDASHYLQGKQRTEYEHWMSKVKNYGSLLKHAPDYLCNDKKLVLAAVRNDGPLRWASPACQGDKEIVLAAVRQMGSNLASASPELKNDREVVLAALYQSGGRALDSASTEMKKDKAMVLTAVKLNPDTIKHAHETLKRDKDVLIAAGMFDKDHTTAINRHNKKTRKIVLSTRFALHSQSESDATNFTKLLKQHAYIQDGGFVVYAPNAFDKKTCDKNWTDYNHPCRGTDDTCLYDNILTEPDGRPTDDCCWRYSFRCQLQEAKDSGGFMLQLVERNDPFDVHDLATLGKGQKIEKEMAEQLQVKVFHVYKPGTLTDYFEMKFDSHHVNEVVANIKSWYDTGSDDMSLRMVGPMYGDDADDYSTSCDSLEPFI